MWIGLGAVLLTAGVGTYFLGNPPLGQHRVGGQTASQTFSDSLVAQLAESACEGNLSKITQLVQRGVAVDGSGTDGITPLGWAITCENLPGIQALLRARADPNFKSKGGITPVYMASTYIDPNILRLLLNNGGDPNAIIDNGDTALWKAMLLGQRSGVWDNYHLLLTAGVDINRYVDGKGTVAYWALSFGKPSLVVDLLARGYKYDLPSLARMVRNSKIDKSSGEYSYLSIIRSELEARGVVAD